MKTKLLIFGITGDLARRKLLPALGQMVRSGEFDELEIIGVSRREASMSELLAKQPELVERASMHTMNLAEAGEYVKLKDSLALGNDEQLLAYLAVPPGAATQIVDFMGEAGLNVPNVKILFEKPFGVDLASAQDFIARTARYYEEDQIYRIDHYLAKEMAQNIVVFRGGNALLAGIWNNNFIESIEIIASEKIDIEGRGQFYEQTGALRDVVQGHLMQLLALTLMDIPLDYDWHLLPELRLKALEQLEPARPEEAYRAQYEEYQKEVGNPGSQTETFVSIRLHSTQPRWLDVPIRLTTGKALSTKSTEIRVYLKKLHDEQSNMVIIRIQPNEGIDIELSTKKPGYERTFETRHLALTFPEDTLFPDAYEQVLVDAIRSEKSLFTSSAEVLRSWEILEPLQRAWSMDNTPLPLYQKNSSTGTVTGSVE